MKKILLLIAFLFFVLGFGQNFNPADIDPSFNQFALPLNNYFVNDSVSHCKVQADGKLIIVISSKRLVRLINNEIDPNFNTGTGFSAVYISPNSTRPLIKGIEIQPDGKIIVYGSFKVFNGSPARNIIRLNADRSKDVSFNIGTGFYASNSYDSKVTHVQYYPAGILVAGEFASYNSSNTINNMAKLSISSGQLDTSFNNGQT